MTSPALNTIEFFPVVVNGVFRIIPLCLQTAHPKLCPSLVLGILCLSGEIDVNLDLRTFCKSKWLFKLQRLMPIPSLHSYHRPFLLVTVLSMPWSCL